MSYKSKIKTTDGHKVFTDNLLFIVPFTIFTILFLLLIYFYGNNGLFFQINSHHTPITDQVFRYLTDLGNGAIAYLLVIVLLWISYRESLTFLAISLLITIVITLTKRLLFPELDRPLAVFGPSSLHLIPGLETPSLHTFPSGHSATAFSLYFYLAVLSKSRALKVFLLLVAIMVCYSRIYLAAHFPADVAVGAIIAMSISLPVFHYSRKIDNKWIDKRLRFEKIPLFKTNLDGSEHFN